MAAGRRHRRPAGGKGTGPGKARRPEAGGDDRGNRAARAGEETWVATRPRRTATGRGTAPRTPYGWRQAARGEGAKERTRCA